MVDHYEYDESTHTHTHTHTHTYKAGKKPLFCSVLKSPALSGMKMVNPHTHTHT